MTEAEWLGCSDPQAMVDWLADRTSRRKLQLCACAWAGLFLRQAQTSTGSRVALYSTWLGDPEWDEQLKATEQFADGRISRSTLSKARLPSGGPYNLFLRTSRISEFSINDAYRALRFCRLEFGSPSEQEICDLIRDVIGNPCRDVKARASWLIWNDSTIPKLAQAIYDNRAFGRLPVLADALEEAGCDNQEILDHCRSTGEHVRGCWVVDLILGKS